MTLYIIFGILMFGVLIFIHEFGHFIAAKKCGVGIYEFAIGMGPKIFSKKGKDGVLYTLRILPIGGYVSMHGEDDDENSDNTETSLAKKPIWQRFIVISAGALMNILLGVVITFFLVVFGGDINSTTIENFHFADVGITTDDQGLRSGDKIIKLGNRRINVWHDYVYELMNIPGKTVDITIIRDGKKEVIHNYKVYSVTDPKTGIALGASPAIPKIAEKTPFEVIKQTLCQPISIVCVTWDSLINTLKGRYGTEAISGPVGVVGEMKEIKEAGGTSSLFFLMLLITINLGVMNLLPFPALDGGRLFLLTIEAIRRKPLPKKLEATINAVGLIVLLGLMFLITCKDILNLF